MSIESLAKEFGVSEGAVQSALNGLDPTALTAVEKAAVKAAVTPGKLSAPKGSTPVAKVVTAKPAALVGGDFTPVAAAVPADETASDKKAELLAQIEELRQQKELAELEKQMLELKADLLSVQAEVMTVSTDLAEQESGHKLWTKVAPELAELAAENGQVATENAIGRQRKALGELRTISDETPLNSEIAVAALKLKQVGQLNRMQAIHNATPQLLPAMGATTGEARVTVDV